VAEGEVRNPAKIWGLEFGVREDPKSETNSKWGRGEFEGSVRPVFSVRSACSVVFVFRARGYLEPSGGVTWIRGGGFLRRPVGR